MKTTRRSALAGMAALAAAPRAFAEAAFPDKPIKIVVPFAPGSATDITARGLGGKLQEILKQPIIVDDKPGASGQLGASAVATAAGDGYTLLMGTNSTNAANTALFKKLSYDPDKDFAPIMRCITGVNALVVNNDLPIKTVAELIDYAKTNPGKLNYSEASASQRVSAEMFNQLAGVKIERVPYKASPQALGDVASGQVQVMFPDLPQALSQIEAGRVRGLGVTGPTRTPVAPDLPAIAETVPGYSLVYWLAVFAPANTPQPIQKALADAIGEAMKDPATAKAMTQGRMDIAPLALTEFAAYVKKETDWWARAIQAAGIEPE
ncbi:MAG: tripartite tricarboxylate transporter substrate binding protein [Alphaproteobacteria bacterium]|nr:tripartite tricarboxylate transporter substrate binding protein [Alphaproteobacteria bacterium]MBV8406027.1 tripartite tricarboxylate transporter substrate binding protein [Alphaproteobacteria bacterium]